MPYKFHIGASVYYEGGRLTPGASGTYKIVWQLPVERDGRLMYRIKCEVENFERVAEEQQLTTAERLPRVLIIEDTVLIAVLLEELVRECGCEVVGLATDIESARQAVARRDYDAVLLDIGLHEGKSFDIADVLLERSVPFAFVTAYHDILEPRHRKVPVVSKPFSTTLLMNTVKSLVQLVDLPQQSRLRT